MGAFYSSPLAKVFCGHGQGKLDEIKLLFVWKMILFPEENILHNQLFLKESMAWTYPFRLNIK